MGQVEDLKLFVSVVEQGSISRAADALGIAKSAVSRRLGQLEARYGNSLILRDPGHWDVTPQGRELYMRAIEIVASAEELEADFFDGGRTLDGPLAVALPREFGVSFLHPTLLAFQQAHPEILLTLEFDDRVTDLDKENFDLAIRITSDPGRELVAEKLRSVRLGLYASAEYLARTSRPECVNDLKAHDLLHYGAARRGEWRFDVAQGPRKISFQPRLNSNSGAYLRDACAAGCGIALLPDFVLPTPDEHGLEPVLPDIPMAEYGAFLVHSTNRRITGRMRVFMDALRESCAEDH